LGPIKWFFELKISFPQRKTWNKEKRLFYFSLRITFYISRRLPQVENPKNPKMGPPTLHGPLIHGLSRFWIFKSEAPNSCSNWTDVETHKAESKAYEILKGLCHAVFDPLSHQIIHPGPLIHRLMPCWILLKRFFLVRCSGAWDWGRTIRVHMFLIDIPLKAGRAARMVLTLWINIRMRCHWSCMHFSHSVIYNLNFAVKRKFILHAVIDAAYKTLFPNSLANFQSIIATAAAPESGTQEGWFHENPNGRKSCDTALLIVKSRAFKSVNWAFVRPVSVTPSYVFITFWILFSRVFLPAPRGRRGGGAMSVNKWRVAAPSLLPGLGTCRLHSQEREICLILAVG
jgi:hypothetical protein